MLKQEHEMSNVMQNFAMKNKHRNSVQPNMITQCKYKLEAQVSLYRSPDIISPHKNVCMLNTSKLLFKSHTAIGFYVKTMSAHGSHLGWRSWSQDTILKVYYPRTIHAMFALNWLTGFRREDF